MNKIKKLNNKLNDYIHNLPDKHKGYILVTLILICLFLIIFGSFYGGAYSVCTNTGGQLAKSEDRIMKCINTINISLCKTETGQIQQINPSFIY